MNNYVILYASDKENLESQVNDHMREGYQPIGGVVVSKGNGIYAIFYQAMVKIEKKARRTNKSATITSTE